ncbi:MAG TPA: hypothetical protein VGH28_14160 [Polyangiaceae bacterium]
MLFGPPVSAWRFLAAALDLTPYQPTATYAYGASFRQVKRALGVRADASSFQHYLYGTRNGVEIIVHTFDVGSGSTSTTYTGVLARVDPPLFLGLGLRAKGFFERVFGTARIRLGDAAVDDALYVDAHDPGRVASLLSLADERGREIVTRATRLLPWYFHASDSSVLVAETGTIVDPARVARWADQATSFAKALAARRASLPITPAEEAFQAVWRNFGDERGLAFDAPRLKLDGLLGGARTEIALETAGQSSFTAVTAHFPRTLDVAFSALRTATPGFLQGIFSQDVRIGHAAFDDAYRVSGYPEAAVAAILQAPGIADTLATIAAHTGEAMMNHQGLYFRLPGALATPDALAALADTVRHVSATVFGAARNVGPYR